VVLAGDGRLLERLRSEELLSMPARIRRYLLMFGLTAAVHGGALDCPGSP
jgi:hypothetical protein